MSLNQKGFAHLFLIIILLAGIGIAVYLTQFTQIFKPKATGPSSPTDLVANGSFETPLLSASTPSKIYPFIQDAWTEITSTDENGNPTGTIEHPYIEEYLNDWQKEKSAITSKVELTRLAGAAAKNGNQFVKIHKNHGIALKQVINTAPGQSYKISFAYSPARYLLGEMGVYWNGEKIDTIVDEVDIYQWKYHTYTVTARSASSVLSFGSLNTKTAFRAWKSGPNAEQRAEAEWSNFLDDVSVVITDDSAPSANPSPSPSPSAALNSDSFWQDVNQGDPGLYEPECRLPDPVITPPVSSLVSGIQTLNINASSENTHIGLVINDLINGFQWHGGAVLNCPVPNYAPDVIYPNDVCTFLDAPDGNASYSYNFLPGHSYNIVAYSNFGNCNYWAGPTIETISINASPSTSLSPVKKTGDIEPPAGGDGDVDLLDFNTFVADFRDKNLRSDFNKNGKLDIFDFNLLVANFGK